jgi:hypothetical protein
MGRVARFTTVELVVVLFGRCPEHESYMATTTAVRRAAASARWLHRGVVTMRPGCAGPQTVDLSSYDAEQVKMMEEVVILVDENDRVLGSESKKTCAPRGRWTHECSAVLMRHLRSASHDEHQCGHVAPCILRVSLRLGRAAAAAAGAARLRASMTPSSHTHAHAHTLAAAGN